MVSWLLALLAAQAQPQEVPVELTYKDNLKIRTKDGEYDGYLGGFSRLHARTIVDRPDDTTDPRRSLPDTVFLRQARIDHGATVHRDWGYRVVVDFTTGQYNQSTGASASPSGVSLRDAWIEWRRFPEFTIRLGQFYEPVSAEELASSRLVEFAERSPLNRLAPGRDLGIEAYGSLLDNVVSYYLMASHGGGTLQDQGRSVADTNDEKELAGLLFVRPLPFLRLGAGGSIGEVDSVDAGTFDLITTELSLFHLDSTTGTLDGRRWRGDGSLLLFGGPASLRVEVLARGDELQSGMGRDEVRSLGAYAAATVYLTGEDKVPDTRVTPLREWGAIELSARAARLRARNAFESGIALPGGNAEAVTAWTLGVSWWYARFLRVTVDLEYERFSDRLDFDDRTARSLTGLVARVQLDF